jgi:hypothetical protein
VWRVDVTPAARGMIESLDSGLREELIARVSEFAERPMELLRRSVRDLEPDDSLTFDFQSELVAGLRFSLFFRDLDPRTRSMTLIGVGHVAEAEEGGAA